MNFAEFDKPIVIPENPFWHIFKRFGRDEFIAFIINTAGTIAASFFISSVLLLSFIGPIIEKIGFFPAHFYEALKIYRTTPLKQRKSLKHYLGSAFRGGLLSLTEDICVHDPLYIAFFILLTTYPGIPLWLIVSFSFVTAVVAVAILEVLVHEIRYLLLKYKLKKSGFELESFWEARFLVKGSVKIEELTSKFISAFNELDTVEERKYEDLYLDNRFAHISGRTPLLRLRKRSLGVSDQRWLSTHKWAERLQASQSIQLIYVKSRESHPPGLDQFRFFPIRKDKFCFMLNQAMPQTIDEVQNQPIKNMLRHKAGAPTKRVSFHRTVLTGKNSKILVAFDKPSSQKNFYIVEIKAWDSVESLITAMRFAMVELPVIQTTQAKFNLDI